MGVRPTQKKVTCVPKIENLVSHIDRYGIHSKNTEKQCPFLISLYINKKIKGRQQYVTNTSSKHYKWHRP
tara:strand:+ start:481 stop:690 length:210 start_codon:yes stop_codon:yes gene_type:complete